MTKHKKDTFTQIDQFFELVQKRIEQRKEELKEAYKQIELREKRRLRSR